MRRPEAAEANQSNTAVKFVYQQQPSPYEHDADEGTTSPKGAEQAGRGACDTPHTTHGRRHRGGGPEGAGRPRGLLRGAQVARQYQETAGSGNESARGGPTDDIPEQGVMRGAGRDEGAPCR